ncbi:hypothetical protein LCGC14_0124510 [marine sediment metagenome]|uniref:Uncharacterized protein n=1 Tax=marine sediment metagenome TaxID=412755 RepID=A0A0F9XMQ6_9ZZZZ
MSVWLVMLAAVGGCLGRKPLPKPISVGTFLKDYPVASDGLTITSGDVTAGPSWGHIFPAELPEHFPGLRGMGLLVETPDAIEIVTSYASDGTGGQYLAGEWQLGREGSENKNPKESFIRRVDPAGGTVLWERRHYSHYSGTFFIRMTRVISDAEGNAYLTGWGMPPLKNRTDSNVGVWVAKYDRDGELLWDHRYGHHPRCAPQGIALSGDGILTVFVERTFQARPTPAWLLRIDAATGKELLYTPIDFEMPPSVHMAMTPDGHIWLAMAYWKGPNEKPVNVPTDANAICFFRFDRDNRLLQRESINTPLTDSIVQFRIDSKGVMWLLASAAQKVPIGYGRPFNGTVIDGPPIVIQEHYYWVSLKPTIRENWSPQD